ncbi:MAG: hypothetical protein AAFS10_20945 [Myxococcota bacterium]
MTATTQSRVHHQQRRLGLNIHSKDLYLWDPHLLDLAHVPSPKAPSTRDQRRLCSIDALDPRLVELPQTDTAEPDGASILIFADAQAFDPHLIEPERLRRCVLVA